MHHPTPDPALLAGPATLRDGSVVLVRPIRPDDEPLLVEFHRSLSEDSVRLRYFHLIQLDARIDHARLARVCLNDFDQDIALVAEQTRPDGRKHVLAIGRLGRAAGADRAEFALLVSDAFQQQGLGTILLHRLIDIARTHGIRRLDADILPDNHGMLALCRRLKMRTRYDADNATIVATLDL
jgi:acetyltransferase